MHGDIDVFEELARRDTSHAVGRLDEVVAWLTFMFSAERVNEENWFAELTCAHQEPRAISITIRYHAQHHLLGGGPELISNLRLSIADLISGLGLAAPKIAYEISCSRVERLYA